MNGASLIESILKLDGWLDTMRSPEGYGGPVAHWWQNCLQYAGAGLDWRYEGIILGYLNLYEKTGNRLWLAKARRAGDDLVRGQLPSGSFRNSSFELNPYTGGTPHEAACDLALLHLSQKLKEMQDPGWQVYFAAAKNNIQDFYIGRLWDDGARCFRDHPGVPSFVPNKAATLVEAILLFADVSGDAAYVDTCALPTLRAILDHQVRHGELDGGILQNSFRSKKVWKFFPYYIARCVPGLVSGYRWTGKEEYLDASLRAMAFVLRWRYDDGSFPQVVYPAGRMNRYPQWIAAVGDLLRAIELLRAFGFDEDTGPTARWLLQGQQPLGGIRTAHGFASQVSQRRPDDLPEFRDLLPVCGWADKAFRYLSEALPTSASLCPSDEEQEERERPEMFQTDCVFRGQRMKYREDRLTLELWQGKRLLYRWRKGDPWPEVCEPEMMWK